MPNVPSDQIIERAVELWCRALRRPRFDNGDTSDSGGMTMMLATVLEGQQRDKVSDIDAAIDKFRTILSDAIKASRETDGRIPYEFNYLGCDYGPDRALDLAATQAGVPRASFSWKSSVSIHEDCVVAQFGYRATPWRHYPLKDGRWLIADLSGGDMPKIIAAVEAGTLTDLTVERN